MVAVGRHMFWRLLLRIPMYIHIVQCRFTVCTIYIKYVCVSVCDIYLYEILYTYIYIFALYTHSITHGPWKQNHAASGVGTNQGSMHHHQRHTTMETSTTVFFKVLWLENLGQDDPRCACVLEVWCIICTCCRFTHLVISKYEILWVVISYQYNILDHLLIMYQLLIIFQKHIIWNSCPENTVHASAAWKHGLYKNPSTWGSFKEKTPAK